MIIKQHINNFHKKNFLYVSGSIFDHLFLTFEISMITKRHIYNLHKAPPDFIRQ